MEGGKWHLGMVASGGGWVRQAPRSRASCTRKAGTRSLPRRSEAVASGDEGRAAGYPLLRVPVALRCNGRMQRVQHHDAFYGSWLLMRYCWPPRLARRAPDRRGGSGCGFHTGVAHHGDSPRAHPFHPRQYSGDWPRCVSQYRLSLFGRWGGPCRSGDVRSGPCRTQVVGPPWGASSRPSVPPVV